MNRQIEFRGKRLDNGEWVYGYYVKYGFVGKEKHYIVPSYASDLYAIEVDPLTIGQFTGLVDNDGKKVYEFDYIRYKIGGHWFYGDIGFDINCCSYVVNKIYNLQNIRINGFEAIGNIFDKEN